jgi:site-specific DNA recombinase
MPLWSMTKPTKHHPSSTTVVAYCRVSTEEQAIEGVSLDAQQARIRAYCAMRGLELVDVVIDAGVSGYKPLAERGGGARLLDMVRARRVHGVVALKLDRLFRNCADCLDVTAGWDRSGIALHLVDLGGQAVDTSSAMGRFFLTVMAGAAELERNQIGERTSLAMQHMREQHQYTGGMPRWGYRPDGDGTLVPVPQELKVSAEAKVLRDGGMSLVNIARVLAQHGFASRVGRAFGPEQVQRILRAA